MRRSRWFLIMATIGPFGFTGGLNAKATIYTQPPNTLSTTQDVRITQNSVVERFGTSTLVSSIKGSGNLAVQGLLPNLLTPNTYIALVVQDGKIYGFTTGGVITDITGTSSFAAGTESAICNSDFLNGIMIISDGQRSSGAMAQWSGSGTCSNLGGGSPDGFSVRTVNNFMFAIEATNTSRVWWSNVGDPTTWAATSFVDFRPKDGDSTAAIHYIGTDLYIFKGFSIGRLSTQNTITSGSVASLGPLTTVNIGIGAAGSMAVDRLPDGRLVFLGNDSHAYLFDGSTLTDISDQAYPDGNAQARFDECAPVRANNGPRVVSYPLRNEVWFAMTTSPITNGNPFDRAMVWNWKENMWYGPYTFPFPNARRLSSIVYLPMLSAVVPTGSGVFGSQGNLLTAFRDVVSITDVNNSVVGLPSPQWNVSIPLTAEGRQFDARSLILFHQGTSASTSFAVTYGFDGGALGNSTTVTTSTSVKRTVIPLVLPTTGASSVGPSSIQIQIANTGAGGVTYNPFYLSDEVLI